MRVKQRYNLSQSIKYALAAVGKLRVPRHIIAVNCSDRDDWCRYTDVLSRDGADRNGRLLGVL